MAGSPRFVEFDGPNRRITVKPGVTNLSVQNDLYSDWKEWVVEDNNAQYPPAFVTLGGEPVNPAQTQFTPRYFFLQDQYGWEILVDGETIFVELNLLTVTGLSAFRVINNGAVTNKTSDAQVIEQGCEDLSLDVTFIRKILQNKVVTNPVTGKHVIYDDDGVTILVEADLFEDVDGTQTYRDKGADRRDRLE